MTNWLPCRRAYWLFVQSGKPADWLRKLKQAAVGNSALADRLNTLLNPVISQEDQEWQENEAKYEEERKKEQEAKARKRAEWIEHLKATPDIVRHPPGLTAGELSEDQCQLLNEVEKNDPHKSRASGANWKALNPGIRRGCSRSLSRYGQSLIGGASNPTCGRKAMIPVQYRVHCSLQRLAWRSKRARSKISRRI